MSDNKSADDKKILNTILTIVTQIQEEQQNTNKRLESLEDGQYLLREEQKQGFQHISRLIAGQAALKQDVDYLKAKKRTFR